MVVLKQVLLNQVSDVINETSVSGDQLVTEFEILCENDDMIYVIEKKKEILNQNLKRLYFQYIIMINRHTTTLLLPLLTKLLAIISPIFCLA